MWITNIQKSYLSWLGEKGPFNFSCRMFPQKYFTFISVKKTVKIQYWNCPVPKTLYISAFWIFFSLFSVMFVTVQTSFLKMPMLIQNYLYYKDMELNRVL